MGKLISTRVCANSIIETVVALTIILVVFIICTAIFIQVNSGVSLIKFIEAEESLESMAIETELSKDFTDKQILTGELRFQQVVKDYPLHEGLLQVELTAIDKNNEIVVEHFRIMNK